MQMVATNPTTTGATVITDIPPRARARWHVDDLVTTDVEVDGRRVSYARGGRGVPVLFLHGWGLDHRAYRRSLRRLTERGCQVIAPSLPGFGGTDDLDTGGRTLADYAAWVDRFLDAIGADEPVLVLGHSFGGGIATKFAHDHPARVRYLVLLNSVGDPGVFIVNGLRRAASARRGDAVRVLRQVLRPSMADLATAGAMQRVFVENVVRRPHAVFLAGLVAVSADLQHEMAALAERQLPVLVLWSDHDGVIPIAAFDTFCSTFGTDGHVVRGGHSWLLANPDAFGEVLDNVIHLQHAERGARVATANVSQLRELLAETTVPRQVVKRLLEGLSPLWVLSASPAVLAGDLALCHPPLETGEVRAVARAMPAENTFRLTVVATDRPGLMADTAATLAAAGVSVVSASVMTWPGRKLALHAVTVRSDTAFDPARWAEIGERLNKMASGIKATFPFVPAGTARVTRTGEGDGTAIVRVTAPDRIGLLSAICRWFADHGVSIEAADIASDRGVVNDVFLIDGDCDTDLLAEYLSAPSTPLLPSPAPLVRGFLRLFDCAHLAQRGPRERHAP